MKKNIFLHVFILIGWILLGLSTYAQVEKKSQVLISLLQNELRKSGLSVDQSSISLVRLEGQVSKKYALDKLPADAFRIEASNHWLRIWSQSDEGLRNGVYWYLHWLGFRYYFPGDIWQKSPQLKSAFKPIAETFVPSFTSRRIWYAYGTGSKQADADYRKWSEANLQGGEEVNAGHAYDGIVNRNKAIFLLHPEFFAQKVQKGEIPKNPKFEVGNEDLVQLIIRDALSQIKSSLTKTGRLPGMISMDPSDGGGFSTSSSSLKIGGPSEQTFYLANRVAKAIRAEYSSVKVGLYAYNLHAAPPAVELEPNIVVLVATAMNQSAYRTDELIEVWKRKNITLGIRDYYGVMAWDWDMPGRPSGSRITYIKQLQEYYKQGIRLFSAETNIGWISRGLGHYIAAQLLLDINSDVLKIKNEFFEDMFGRAAGEMEQLFDAWQKYNQPVPLDGDLYEWNKLVERAGNMEKDARAQERIRQVKQYLHYVYLFKLWREKDSEENLINLLNYAYRVQDKGIVASYPLFRRLSAGLATGKPHLRFDNPKAVWKAPNLPLNEQETEQNLNAALRSLDRTNKTEVAILPPKLGKEKTIGSNKELNERISLPVRLRGTHKIIFHIQNSNAAITLSAGLIKAKEFKTLRFVVYPYRMDLATEGNKPLLQRSLEPKKPETILLGSLSPGTYIAVIDDARNGFSMNFSGDVSYGIMAGSPHQAWTFGRNNLVLNVKNVKSFNIQNDGAITLRSPKGRIIDLQKQKGLIKVPLEPGEEGLWQLVKQSGRFNIQGVMPLLSADKDFLIQHEE